MTKSASTADLYIAHLVHEIAACLTDRPHHETGKPCYRFGDRKVFISAVWDALAQCYRDELAQLGITDLQFFGAWILAARHLVDQSGHPLVVLARADLVAAMHAPAVEDSTLREGGIEFHFLVDRTVDRDAYRAVSPPPLPEGAAKPTRPVTLPSFGDLVGPAAIRPNRKR